MKVKLQTIIDAIPAITLFAQKDMPAKAAYRVSKLVRKMLDESRDFQEQKNKVVTKHGTPVKDKPGQFELSDAQTAASNAELTALLEEEVDLEGCIRVAWADVENLQVSPAVLADLNEFIEAPPKE